jgi:ferredoxin/flavodoxin
MRPASHKGIFLTTEIYYFSGTGNSLAVARDLGGKLDGTLVSIPAVIDREWITPGAGPLGIVFPVYHGGLPLIVYKFVKKLAQLEHRYVFAVCTYGDSPGLAIAYLADMISQRGGQLVAGFAVHMPYNYLTPVFYPREFSLAFTLRFIPSEKQKALFAAWRERLESITSFVNSGKAGVFETRDEKLNHLIDRVHLKDSFGKKVWLKMAGYPGQTELPLIESRQLMDYAFHYDEQCTGCGICARICPVDNIEMVADRPVWQGRCEQCFACLQWCPKESIQFGSKTTGRIRYHHPGVKISEMTGKHQSFGSTSNNSTPAAHRS